MAVPSTLTPAGVLNKVLEDRVSDIRITGARTLANLAQAGRIQTAMKTNLDWPVAVGGEQAGVGAITAVTTTTADGDTVNANLRVGQHRVFARFDISRVDIQEAMNIAPAELANLFGVTMDRAVNAIARRLNGLLYSGDGTNGSAGIFGFNRVLDNTQDYAGLSVATYPRWRGLRQVNRNYAPTLGGTPATAGTVYSLTIDGVTLSYTTATSDTAEIVWTALRSALLANQYLSSFVTITITGSGSGATATINLRRDRPISSSATITLGVFTSANRAFSRALMLDMDEYVSLEETMYDMVIMHPTLAKVYSTNFDTIASQYSVPQRTDARGLLRAELGHGGRFYNGYPIIEDQQADPNRIYHMKSDDVTLYCFELSDPPANDPNAPRPISPIVVNRSLGVPLHIAEIASGNSAVRTFEVYVLPQIQVFDRRSVMTIDNLSLS